MDYLRRLQDAWTPADGNCDVAPSAAGLGGPARYWHSYSYDALGNRTLLREHATSQGDRDTTYTVPASAHLLTGATTADASGTIARAYTYDASGNMRTRSTDAAGVQTMTWDAEGHLATSQDATGTTSYVYDADGNRLVRNDPTGTTLYLPGQELRHTAADGSKHSTRYYVHADQPIATRTAAAGVVWLSGDHQGTAQIAITAVDQAAAIRRETPFGGVRGTTGAWPSAMDRSFVGGVLEPTGLIHLGARDYDSALGRFISVDPIFDDKDPQSWTGFAYSDNNPVTMSDPEGTTVCDSAGNCSVWKLEHSSPVPPPAPSPRATPPSGRSGHPGPPRWPSSSSGGTSGSNVPSLAGGGTTVAPPQLVRSPLRSDKGSFLGLRMVGICPLSGGISLILGINGSACIGVDAKGIGTFETVGASAGAQGGIFAGSSIVASTGDLDHQRGPFEFYEASGGGEGLVGFGSWAHAGSTDTFQLGVGRGIGSPLNLARGLSYTWVQRLPLPWPW